ncbi:hypothetical protein HU200_008454 [Digitaria exilis]|uniref:Uncharacterized protein n=1 Tax=Digitaria exilis TaxID=1010633 RepID=A0A835KTL0_9POAL|nr:hypothetical protein HU200_008454 [Digitaria exilis]
MPLRFKSTAGEWLPLSHSEVKSVGDGGQNQTRPRFSWWLQSRPRERSAEQTTEQCAGLV